MASKRKREDNTTVTTGEPVAAEVYPKLLLGSHPDEPNVTVHVYWIASKEAGQTGSEVQDGKFSKMKYYYEENGAQRKDMPESNEGLEGRIYEANLMDPRLLEELAIKEHISKNLKPIYLRQVRERSFDVRKQNLRESKRAKNDESALGSGGGEGESISWPTIFDKRVCDYPLLHAWNNGKLDLFNKDTLNKVRAEISQKLKLDLSEDELMVIQGERPGRQHCGMLDTATFRMRWNGRIPREEVFENARGSIETAIEQASRKNGSINPNSVRPPLPQRNPTSKRPQPPQRNQTTLRPQVPPRDSSSKSSTQPSAISSGPTPKKLRPDVPPRSSTPRKSLPSAALEEDITPEEKARLEKEIEGLKEIYKNEELKKVQADRGLETTKLQLANLTHRLEKVTEFERDRGDGNGSSKDQGNDALANSKQYLDSVPDFAARVRELISTDARIREIIRDIPRE